MAWRHRWRFPFAALDAKRIESAFRRMSEGYDGIRAVKLHGSGLPERLAITVEFDGGVKGRIELAADDELGASLTCASHHAANEALGETIAEVAAALAAELGGEDEA